MERSGFARRASWDVEIDLRDIDDSCMMEAILERIASVLPAIVE
jgi:hypothetical protein